MRSQLSVLTPREKDHPFLLMRIHPSPSLLAIAND